MQTEMMMRLLCKDKDSPSGYRIVGYAWQRYDFNSYCILENQSDNLENIKIYHLPIYYHAFELGVKIGDEWLFEGDIMEYINPDNGRECETEITTSHFERLEYPAGYYKNMRIIGNIHEGEKLRTKLCGCYTQMGLEWVMPRGPISMNDEEYSDE